MKILFLNVWNAKLREPLVEYLRKEMQDTDIFCFQECFDDARITVDNVLIEYQAVRAKKNVSNECWYAQSIYIKKGITILGSEAILEDLPQTGLGLWVQLQSDEYTIYLCNYHGSAQPGDKKDTIERIHASATLIASGNEKDGVRIIGGDFNLDIETESIRAFTKQGYQNLIVDYDVPTTRNKYVWDLHSKKMCHSDYVFVSGVQVHEFYVPENEVSDHLPLVVRV